MRIDKLLLRNFRNYKQLELTLDPYLNIFVGANAQGKTNLLESLIFVASGHSFRTKSEEELVRFGEKESNVEAHIEHRQGRERLRVNYHLQNKKKNYFSNGVELIRSDFVGRLIPVLFTPEDLAVVKGSPQVRRNFFDDIICKIYPVYEHELHRYQQIVRQRNQLLKFHREKILNSPELESWNEQLAKQGARVIEKRMFATHRIGLLARLAHRSLTGRDETLDVEYLSSIPKELDTQASETEMALLQGLKEKGKHEARVGQTLLGPHRDDILFSINKKNARLFASQGQQRTLVLALKLAELEFIKGESGEFPILLFDDVFSELDDKRRRLLVETIEGRVQTLITGTAAERLGVFKSAGKIFTVHGGEVKLFDSHSSTTR